ncbi:MAG: AMP-binding protein [Bacteroidota bacterium]
MDFGKTPLQHFFHHVEHRPNSFFLHQPVAGKKVGITWGQAGEEVRKIAHVLQSKGIQKGDRVALVSKNCAWWILTDLAIMMSGAVSVPIYPNVNAEILSYILEHSGSKMMFAGKLDTWDDIKPGVPAGMPIIGFPYYEASGSESWNALLESTEPLERYEERAMDNMLTIIYTSGTTGKPKGVVHNLSSFTYAMNMFPENIDAGDHNERAMSYLPLAHIAERALIELGSLERGSSIYFSESLETFVEDIKYACPTIFGGVPRIWMKLRMGILAKMDEKKLDRMLKIPFVSKMVQKKVKEGLGLHESKLFLTGAAPTPPPLAKWYRKVGIPLLEVYGMTENTAYSHCNRQGNMRIGSAGLPLEGVEVKFSEEKEILMKTHALMAGYYKEPELTAEVMEDGFFKTGDVGHLDKDGFLFITGRVKEIFKTSKGKYVSPASIEGKLLKHSWLDQACVTGGSLPQPLVLVVLSEIGKAQPQGSVEKELETLLAEVNPLLEKHEKMKTMVVLDDEWTIESGALTPTMKLKRPIIEKWYAQHHEKWDDLPETVVFA